MIEKEIYWHIIADVQTIGLLEKGTKEEVAQKLKDSLVKQLDEMTIERFLKMCHCRERIITATPEWKDAPLSRFVNTRQEYIDDQYRRPKDEK